MTSPAMIDSAVLMDVRDGVAWLTLAAPETRNAIGPAIAAALRDAANACADDPAVRCVVLTGAGRFFSVGGDIALFNAATEDTEAQIGALADTLHAAVHLLATMDKPLVTAINGPAAGAGLSLAILGDIAIAGASAHFTVAYSAIGLTPDGGASWLLPRLVGLRRAQEMVLTNRRIGAEEASAIGLVTRTVPDEALMETVQSVAATLAAGATHALGQCRRLLLASATADLRTQLDAEGASIAAASGGPEGREGIAAFIHKRPPDFHPS